MSITRMSSVKPQRRAFLKAAGITIALPALESLPKVGAAEQSAGPPKRMVCIGNEFGMYPEAFWPKQTGTEFELTPSLAPLAAHRKGFTLFSHLDHGLKGGHFAVHTFLTGVKSTDAKGMPEGGISLDQRAAEFVGSQTRFPSIAVGSESGLHGGPMMSWTRTGTRVPPITGPRQLFKTLFVDEGEAARAIAKDRIALRNSILDAVLDDAKSLKRKVNPADYDKLDEYFTSVRSVEQKLQLDRQWQDIPKPRVDMAQPEDEELARDLPKIYDLIALAIQTDSTRVATVEVGGSFAASDLGIKSGYHGLSHHGHVQASIDLLVQIELYQVQQLARFLDRLASLREPDSDRSLLDSTMVLMGSGMGNANSHTNNDLPVILAGGGFKHGQHLSYPSETRQRIPLCNLYVSMLQRFGLEVDTFSTGNGTLTGLEVA